MREMRRRTRVVWCFTRWEIGTHAGSGQAAAHCRYPMGNQALPEDGFAAGSRPSRDLCGMNPD